VISKDKGVLVVSSDISTRNALCGLLDAAGFRGLPVVNGIELISRMKVDRPDCVVIDVDDAFCEPLGLVGALWRGEPFGQIPALLLVSDRRNETIMGLLAAGAADVFTKPILPGALLSRVREIVTLRLEAREPATRGTSEAGEPVLSNRVGVLDGALPREELEEGEEYLSERRS